MIKGAQKQLIVIRTENSRFFDEAYFVLRREIRTRRGNRNEMLQEANRILEECVEEGGWKSKRRDRRRAVWFFVGLLLGAALAVGIVLPAC